MGAVRQPQPAGASPRIVAVRTFGEMKAVTAMLGTGIAVLVVLRGNEDINDRCSHFLAGWSAGSGGGLDRIGPHTLVAQPPAAARVRLAANGATDALEEAFREEGEQRLTRDIEDQLLPLAAAGSVAARRRLTDAYAEFATLVALWVRPYSTSQSTAVAVAQEELESLISWPPLSRGLLVALVNRIESRLTH